MSQAKAYVDRLFSKYKDTNEVNELKEEVLSNIEARIIDNLANGFSKEEAFNEAIKNIEGIELLIEGNKEVYINAWKKEVTQVAILYSLIAWIITIPIRINIRTSIINTILLFFTIFLFAIYNFKFKDKDIMLQCEILNEKKLRLIKKYSWLIWGIFIFVITLANLGVRFASNIWFSREITFNGPYDFAMFLTTLIIPFVTVIIPLTISKADKLLIKYEVNNYEKA